MARPSATVPAASSSFANDARSGGRASAELDASFPRCARVRALFDW